MLNFLKEKIARPKLAKFVESHASGSYTLDLGCFDSPYSKYFPNRLGFDIASGKGVDVVGDAHKLPFENEKFECILCTEVLKHLHSPHIGVKEMYRVLKPGGKLILSTRFNFPIHDAPGDYFRYTEFGLRHLFKEWKIESLQAETTNFETFALLLQRLGFHYRKEERNILAVALFFFAKLLHFFTPKKYKKMPILTSGYYIICRK